MDVFQVLGTPGGDRVQDWLQGKSRIGEFIAGAGRRASVGQPIRSACARHSRAFAGEHRSVSRAYGAGGNRSGHRCGRSLGRGVLLGSIGISADLV